MLCPVQDQENVTVTKKGLLTTSGEDDCISLLEKDFFGNCLPHLNHGEAQHRISAELQSISSGDESDFFQVSETEVSKGPAEGSEYLPPKKATAVECASVGSNSYCDGLARPLHKYAVRSCFDLGWLVRGQY